MQVDSAALKGCADLRRASRHDPVATGSGERQMMCVHTKLFPAACAIALAAAAHGQILQIDINGLTADSGGAFGGTSHTGTVAFSVDPDSFLVAVLIDGVSQSLSAELAGVQGVIELDNGVVIGGGFTIDASDGSQFIASLVAGAGIVRTQAGQGFRIQGLTFSGAFASANFAGVNVAAWGGNQLEGTFLLHSFGPDAGGIDTTTDLDVWVEVPAPAGTSLLVFAGVMVARRRR